MNSWLNEKIINESLQLLDNKRILTITGSVGCGKSTFISKGILPVLSKKFQNHKIIFCKIAENPFSNLANSLAQQILDTQDVEVLKICCPLSEISLKKSENGILETIKELNNSQIDGIFLILESFERIFSPQNSKEEIRNFLNLILCAATQEEFSIHIILSLRSEFLSDCAEYFSFFKTISQGIFSLKSRENDENAKNQLENLLENIFSQLKNEKQREICKILFQHLTLKTEKNEILTLQTSISKIVDISQSTENEILEVIEFFAKKNFLKTERNLLTNEVFVEMLYENLFLFWERLNNWVNLQYKNSLLLKNLTEKYQNFVKTNNLPQFFESEIYEILEFEKESQIKNSEIVDFWKKVKEKFFAENLEKEKIFKQEKKKFFIFGGIIVLLSVCFSMFYGFWQYSKTENQESEAKRQETIVKEQLIVAHKNKARAEKLLYDVIDIQSKNFDLIEAAFKQTPHNDALKKQLATAYSDFAWYLILNKKFQEAVNFAKKGLEIDKEQEWIYTNLATAYLCNNEFEKAKEIYEKFKEKPYFQGGSYKEVFLGNIIALEEEGIKNPDFDKIFKILQ